MPGQDVRWGPARESGLLRILRNPIYAGVYVFGRHEERMALVDGELRRGHKRVIAPNAGKTCLHDHHPAYIDWEELMANQRKLDVGVAWPPRSVVDPPVANLASIEQPKTARVLGGDRGKIWVALDAFEPLGGEELAVWTSRDDVEIVRA